MRPTVWTSRRQWIGNLIPMLFWLPPTMIGLVWMGLKAQLVGPGLGLVALGTILGWLALNQFGFYENGRMRRQLERILADRQEELPVDRNFVGFATPSYTGLVDAHEDVGFFYLRPSEAVFISETRKLEIERLSLADVRFRPNIHTFVGLGGWISLEGHNEGKPFRLMIEPRDRRTLIGNLRRREAVRSKIRRWLKDGTTPVPPKPEAQNAR
ncbi:MAG TPA: hypothetical protein VGE01_06845 [Fimbriimonas sp.]